MYNFTTTISIAKVQCNHAFVFIFVKKKNVSQIGRQRFVLKRFLSFVRFPIIPTYRKRKRVLR